MKLPPYSKPLHQLLTSGQKPTNSVYVFIGSESWDRGKVSSRTRPTRTIALPPDHSPFAYDWPVKGCEILIIETSELVTEYIESIAQALFDYDAERVVLLSLNLLSTTYKKDF